MISKGVRWSVAAAAWLAAGTAAANRYNLQDPQSIIAREIYDLHTLIMWIIVGIFVVVFGAMTYAIIYHRKSVGHQAEQFHENTTVEIVWTIIPFLILIGMAWPATKTIIQMKDTSQADITIKATGYQWKWGYDYLQEASASTVPSRPRASRSRTTTARGRRRTRTICSKWTITSSCLSARRCASLPPPTT